MNNTEKLVTLKTLFNDFECQKNNDEFVILFSVSKSSIKRFLKCQENGILFDSYLVNEIYVEINDLSANEGQTAKASISAQQLKTQGLNVYWDWEDLLAYKPNITAVPDNFLIISEKIVYPTEPTSNKTKHYKEICTLLNLLISNADHTNNLTKKIINDVVFLHKSRLEIPIAYNQKCLGEGLDGISIIVALFKDQSHIEQKSSILKETLYSLLINVSKKDRLQYLLNNFGDFSKRLNENYQLFVSEFSFDDVRKEYEEKKRDYLTKLNDVFSSAQTKMLGVPIALALASLKLSAIVDNITFWTNFFLALSITIYSVMMFMLITNQKHTLKALKNEYESQMARLKHQYADQYEQVKEILTDLNLRYDHQNNCLSWFYVMTAALFILVLALFFWNLPWKLILGI